MDKKWTTLVPQRQLIGKSGKPINSHLNNRRNANLIGRLPEEAYIQLFINLPLCDVGNLARTCRKAAALAGDERVWKRKLDALAWKGDLPPEALKITGNSLKKDSLNLNGNDRRRSQVGDSSSFGAPSSNTPSKRASTSGASSSTSAPIAATSAPSIAQHIQPTSKPPANGQSLIAAVNHTDDDDDGFGDFIDFTSTSKETRLDVNVNNTNGMAFASIDLNSPPLRPAKAPVQPRKSEDLLMLFDDGPNGEEEDLGLNHASPPRPSKPSSSTAIVNGAGRTSISGSITANGLMHHASPTLSRDLFKACFQSLIPYYVSLQYQSTSSLVFTKPSLSSLQRAYILSNLSRLLSNPTISPTQIPNKLSTTKRNLQSSIDYFEASTLANFEKSIDARVQSDMRDAAHAAYALNGGKPVIQIFINKIPLFYDQSWDPLANLTKTFDTTGHLMDGIDFSAMDDFMNHVIGVVQKEGTMIARVFPQDSDALVYFTDRIANDVISDYIVDLLMAAHNLQHPLFLLTAAAAFGQCQRLISTVLNITPKSSAVNNTSISTVVYKMFEPHTTDYLKEEPEWCRTYLKEICIEWERKLAEERANRDPTLFLNTSNPQQAKKNILAGFTKALLLPVTIVPKTVAFSVNAITTGGTMAFNAMSGGFGGGSSTPTQQQKTAISSVSVKSPSASAPTTPAIVANNSAASGNGFPGLHGESFQSLISIETAMQLIQADRECLKRVQTFTGYTGDVGHRVKRVAEEIFVILCQTVSANHLTPAFAKATQQMGLYKPSDHAVDESVAPLVQFFELVHIGDTILQMVQVYYDREMVKYVDKNDFLSQVVREKKKFENALDESVASGLNAGVNILMTQAEHILQTRQDPSDYCPELRDKEKGKAGVVDIEGPTKAADAVVDCLRSHCQMLKGSTDKAILEVFHQEVGLRLHGMLLKHLKKSIVSIAGGFQVIADLNLYTSFISSLKLPTVQPYFTALKMAANVFIIDSPRDLGMMARDLERYEGTLRIEDIMEMVQCRTDWKKIEREVEKEVFGFKTEDCIIA